MRSLVRDALAMLIASSAVATVGLWLTVSPAQAERVLKLGHIMSPSHHVHKTALKFAEEVRARTGSEVEVQVLPSGQLGTEKEMFESMRLGSLEMGIIAGNAIEGFEPSAGLFSLPYLLRSNQHAFDVQDGPVGREIARRVLSKTGVRYLAFGNIGFRNVLTKDRAIRALDDFDGLKIRVPPSPAFVAAFELLDANPTPIPGGEMYTALQTGVVDGVEGTPDILEDFKMFEVAGNYTLTRHIFTDIPLVIAESVWASLSTAHQNAIQEAALVAQEFERDLIGRIETETLARVKAKGVNIYEIDTAPLRERMAPYYDEFAKRIGGPELIDQVVATK